jgi:hypothetical protein
MAQDRPFFVSPGLGAQLQFCDTRTLFRPVPAAAIYSAMSPKPEMKRLRALLRQVEAELEAAAKRSGVDAAARKLMRAKAELKRLQQAARKLGGVAQPARRRKRCPGALGRLYCMRAHHARANRIRPWGSLYGVSANEAHRPKVRDWFEETRSSRRGLQAGSNLRLLRKMERLLEKPDDGGEGGTDQNLAA